jgi:hypothetical protein
MQNRTLMATGSTENQSIFTAAATGQGSKQRGILFAPKRTGKEV